MIKEYNNLSLLDPILQSLFLSPSLSVLDHYKLYMFVYFSFDNCRKFLYIPSINRTEQILNLFIQFFRSTDQKKWVDEPVQLAYSIFQNTERAVSRILELLVPTVLFLNYYLIIGL